VIEQYALTDASVVLSGLRRLGADLAFIQLLQYYSSEVTEEEHREMVEEGHWHMGTEGNADLHPNVRLSNYPKLISYALRAASLDPYFHYNFIFTAGALAFNLNRDDEALTLLSEGARWEPNFWQYRLYAGAIGFRKSNSIDKVVALLEEAIKDPDCPSMVENILANIYKRQGNYQRAAEIYALMIQTSRDPAYVGTAKQKLDELRAQHGVRI
jgi:tetratricopeptide (TPR) repeat protein